MSGMRPSASAALKSGYFWMVSADWTRNRLGAACCTARAVTSWRGAVTTTSLTALVWSGGGGVVGEGGRPQRPRALPDARKPASSQGARKATGLSAAATSHE